MAAKRPDSITGLGPTDDDLAAFEAENPGVVMDGSTWLRFHADWATKNPERKEVREFFEKTPKWALYEIALHLAALSTDSYDEALRQDDGMPAHRRLMEEHAALKANGII